MSMVAVDEEKAASVSALRAARNGASYSRWAKIQKTILCALLLMLKILNNKLICGIV